MDPKIIIGGSEGFHNSDIKAASDRIKDGKAYKSLSTIIVVPTRGMIPARAVENWMGLMTPMNHPAIRMFISGMEVGDAYNKAVEVILSHSGLQDFKYMLTLEEDNLPPPDGLLKLYESIDKYAVVGGLYWTKGEAGQPMIYGNPKAVLNFMPQIPKNDTIQECNGLGMGFTLFNLDIFKDKKLKQPWFKTVQEWDPYTGGKMYTQDLFFFEQIRKAGYRVACDTRVKVGHYDFLNDIVW